MKDLMKFARECMSELDKLKIPYSKSISFSINSRAKTRLGLCRKRGKQYEIEIAASLLTNEAPEKALKDTIHHELLHTCFGCMKHTGRWKQYAEKVNAAYGYNIKRASEPEESIKTAAPKYIIACSCCGAVYERYKRSKLVINPERYRCGKCGNATLHTK